MIRARLSLLLLLVTTPALSSVSTTNSRRPTRSRRRRSTKTVKGILDWFVNTLDSPQEPQPQADGETWFGQDGVCVIGCTPYVDFTPAGLAKYRQLVQDMAQDCDILVHLGDTKPGRMPCNENTLTTSVHILADAAAAQGKLALYAPGDNEINDCHRLEDQPADFYRAADARQFLIDDLGLAEPSDLTGQYTVQKHVLGDHSCEFDTYVSTKHYSVATLEVLGTHYYLADERDQYPAQDTVDPLADRLDLFLNANACTLDWIAHVANQTASDPEQRALILTLHAKFHRNNGRERLGNGGIGEYYRASALGDLTKARTGTRITHPYQPLFDRLTAVALEFPHLAIYVVHGDGHQFQTYRMNGAHNNRASNHLSNHNLMIHQVEGASRAMTMYSKFTVDSTAFQPVQLHQRWSQGAYNAEPVGHAWDPY